MMPRLNLPAFLSLFSSHLLFFLILPFLFAPAPAQAAELDPGLELIVGGNSTNPGDWPSTVALLDHGSPDTLDGQFCGGTLIAPNWVLTAAHCTQDLSAGEIDAVIGRHDLTSDTGERIQIAAIRRYPGYNWETDDGDLALLRLSQNSSQPVLQVISQGDPDNRAAVGVGAVTVGWGATSEGGSGSDTLLQVGVPILSLSVANQADWYDGQVTANMIPAGFAEGGKDSCQGDSGGPFMVPDGSGGWILAGAVSWGEGCAVAKKPGVYTRLSQYSDWIEQTMNSDDPSVIPGLNLPGLFLLCIMLAAIGIQRTRRPSSKNRLHLSHKI